MENLNYGMEFVYAKYGEMAVKAEMLVEQAAYWKRCYEELAKESNEKIGSLEAELKEAKENADIWFNSWLEKCGEMRKEKQADESMKEEKEEQTGEDF